MELLLSLLGVAVLGGAGSGLRYLASFWQGALPWGILVANTVASFLAGAAGSTGNFELAILVGFTGGLSTFSTFAAQSFDLWTNGHKAKALANATLNFTLPALGLLTAVILL
jgi:CrcB protein